MSLLGPRAVADSRACDGLSEAGPQVFHKRDDGSGNVGSVLARANGSNGHLRAIAL